MRFLPLLALSALAACDPAADAADKDDGTDTDSAIDTDSGGDTDSAIDTDSGGDSSPDSGDDTASDDCYTLADGSCVEETFANPPVLAPEADGVYRLSLGASEIMVDGERHCLRTYNGSYPGPTIDIPARLDADERKVRVDLFNTFTAPDYNSLDGGSCGECVDSMGMDCDPTESHGDAMDCNCFDDEGNVCSHVADFNTTNLHFHGGHVEPDYANGGGCTTDGTLRCSDCDDETDDGEGDDTCFYGDNVLTKVGPTEGTQHRFDIDEDGTHHEGLFWYHPHIHGTTAIQVASGAAGALVVRGPLDEVAGIKQARERIITFSTPPINDDGFQPLAADAVCTEETITFNSFAVLGSTSAAQTNIINGMRRPRMVTSPGQVERWRIAHMGFLDEVFMGLQRGSDSECTSWSMADNDTMTLTQIARDGIVMPGSYDASYLFMSPGYRIEAMLGGAGKFNEGETWCLVAGRFLQEDDDGSPVSPPESPTPDAIDTMLVTGDLVMILNVSADYGLATEINPPDAATLAALSPSTTLDGISIEERCEDAALVESADDIDQLAILQVGIFTGDDPDPCECDNYNVNCRNFEETDREVYPYDRDLRVDTIEHWRIAASFDGHPFHIHTNPVLVCPSENPFDPVPFAHWRDTYLANTTRRVDAVAHYRKFTGAYVQHCHKLTHEDHGMMELLRTCDPATDPTCGDYAWDRCEPDDLVCNQKLSATLCALGAGTEAEAIACSAELGGPLGICGENACNTTDDCADGETCESFVCLPDGPPIP